ncbi:NAD(P)/FAD-dependent oxidoreductase [Natranaerobius thermophilus]|uniref:FAD-dependent pyridine nucleotide-disulphide oxidoreductase n=1 Tax=Natranaerobius thermophilus (strain ATCC BAA-1301 / DSM 18059 / JW/NM-WN-LF) TaxID=457570 RepID=B2A3S5_NATTJ|nr:FAD-dependent oxidoreductase [Natranaerobius thermophilus]ACB83701.1 FAD-dependent pyridine nucleotide-disulphide oxidoreductase [Natranaerobius thermophilus JW/NM-WN-LF]
MHYVIVGSGVSGITAAKNLRNLKPEAKITILGDEPHYCYNRPRLIELLGKEVDIENIFFYPPDWYCQQGIDIYLNVTVKEIHSKKQLVITDCGQEISYDKLLLANGSTPNLPPVPGAENRGVFTIRTIDEVRQIQRRALTSSQSIVIGGGLLGLETAFSLTKLKQEVTVIDRNSWLLKRQIDQKGSELLQEILKSYGISVVLEGNTESIEPPKNSVGDSKDLNVNLKDGRKIPGQIVIFSAGVRPNISLAEKAGISVNKGIVVDEHLKTSDPNIYASGDVAEFQDKSYGIIPAALEQGKLAAVNMASEEGQNYEGTIPSTSLKIAGIDLISLGEIYPQEDDQVVTKIDSSNKIFKKAIFRENCLKGAILLGDKTELPLIHKNLRAQQPFRDPELIFENY